MKKGIMVMVAALFASALFMITAYSQEDMTVVDQSVFKNPQKPPSLFKHDAHNEKAKIEECSECHHVYEGGKRVEGESSEDKRCSDCHRLESSGREPSLTRAFHTNCKGCHQKNRKGPIMCGECHVRQ
ncbi:MAG: acidic tetraheme cytochrome c3 TmcA [Thermodesulfobacteriota bacterium]